ncbi:hypothetical protein QTI51_03905 [Variovorax sp. J22G73]|uniref:hypothetical protein n=1 Tax=unclassified Variovorax TaxID=663243 RepID=UPI002576F090|nr:MULTISPECIES: hypothetical protein [unclassified Variovorax]MDM0003928.1 hypothetical protein [Variovorax sp. J22R203]MDM0096406.1 hypothetical protein [Variovorax sp. J22G73]
MTPQSITITLRQAEQLLAFFGGHDAEVTIARESPGLPAGLYAWLTDDPGEGSAYLGTTEVDDDLADKGRPGPVAQLAVVMKLADDYAHSYAFVGDDSMPRAREALQTALRAFLPGGLAQQEREQPQTGAADAATIAADFADGDTCTLMGVRADGSTVNLGAVPMPPLMKARDVVRSYFPGDPDDDMTDAAMALQCCREVIDHMRKAVKR